MGAANGVAADSGVAASPWSYLACETPCCDQEHSFLVENRNAARLGLSNFEPPHAEMDIKDFKSKGFTRMEIVCASELDTYRINRWAKDESDAELAKQMEGLPPALTSMMALAPPEGYLADGPDGQLVRDFGDTTELVDYDAPNRQASTVPSTPTTPTSLAEKAPILKDVWVKNRSATEISTRFTYCVPSRTLGPLLREKLISHEVMQIGTEEMLKACIQDTKKRYFYSGLAEGADGLVHSDAKKLVESFLRAVEGVRSKATTPPASPASTSEARANVWISCPFTGASTHYDMGYNIVLQLFGTKTFELLPPEAFVELNIPPTGHPFARQVMKEGRHNFSRFHLKRGDALYVPPLWAHRTTTGEGAEQEVSISLNIFIGSAAEDVAEQLNALALPFEASWPSNTMQFAVALYLKAFLDEAQVDARYLAARWALVELKEELPANCTAVIPQSESILKRGRDAALLLQALPRKHRAPIALDYADDVLLGVLEAKVIHSVIR
ncbi:tRNA wybutosine-synthesizing protein 4 (tRNA-yW synthesizing protein 4) (Leucine carboxyl methyltransferase 2) (tRNA(Phe) (7-(3-amino-3-(methoxycarbonyl)propyl)wyosine(37)-N)-methoxycarbonyltransferase) (tRNA(Phe) (7-(3-amino-3-carboxypropyl)wyosine(37)-O)-methyltransferase), partial [Durusdinium trenchii]